MQRFVLRASWVIDGTGREPLAKGAVLVEGERIAYVGPADGAPRDPEAEVMDLAGCTLLPGLIDCHVHLTMDGAADAVAQVTGDDAVTATLRAVRNLERQVRAGITTVRDCGCPGDLGIQLARAVRRGLIPLAPRVLAAGPALCITGGHGWFFGREVDGDAEVRKAVRELIKAGVDFIKLIVTGGVLTPGVSPGALQMTPEEIRAAVREARAAGRPVAAHAHGGEGIKEAIRAGVTTVEHASYVDEEAVELFRRHRTHAVSTLLASVRQVEHLAEVPRYVAEKIQHHIERERRSIRWLIDAGVPIAAGTDAGTPFNPHGGLVDQLLLLHELGLSPLQAIQAATQTAAKALQREQDLGTLEPGKLADAIAVAGNPVDDLRALKQVVAVWRSGRRLV